MGTRFGVVATLGALAACNGRYEVGSGEGGEAGMSSASGGSESGGTGGFSGSGGTGTSSGGSNTAGNGSAAGGAGGTSTDTGGSAGAGIAGTGTGGELPTCNFMPPEALPEYTPAAPTVVWQRISRFLYDEEREIDYEFPEETTKEWVETFVGSLLDAHSETGAPDGLEKFFSTWFGVEATQIDGWSDPLASPNAGLVPDIFGALRSPSRRALFEDQAFLTAYPSAPLRGAWLLQNLFCVDTGTPPPETSEPAPPPGPSETSRQAFEAHTGQAACHGCHSFIDPLGFSLEHFDDTGTYRDEDNGLPVDSSGVFQFDPHGHVTFADNRDLISQVGLSCEVGSCFTSAFLDYAIDQAYAGEGPEIAPVERQYVLGALSSEYHRLRPMMLAVVTTPSFLKE